MSVKISAVIIGSINIDEDTWKKIEDVKIFKIIDRKSCDEIVKNVAEDDIVFIISDGREVYYAEKFFSRLPALKIYLVTEAQAADNKNLSDAIIQLPAQDFKQKIYEVAKAFNDILNVEGLVVLNFDDIKAILKNSGKAVAFIGEATGENAVQNCVVNALENHDIKSAQSVIANFKGSANDCTMSAVQSATEKIQAAVSEDAQIIWGVTVEESFGDKVKVAVIAGKFNG